MAVSRDERIYDEPPPSADEVRFPSERDRDRIIHTSAFRRLAAVTQVVPATEDGFLVHNRLTHTIKVAQIARRLAQRVQRRQPTETQALGGIDADVVEAAALAHDLGHPPFGHIAEEELDAVARETDLADGFEGNAQSFRIVTKLSLRTYNQEGLNLTRATLNAIIKYPWFRGASGKAFRKWNAYETERDEFEWARRSYLHDKRKSAEAELMDWSDDIAYSVHDVEDFYRVGLIPLDRLNRDANEAARFLAGAFARRSREGITSKYADTDLASAFHSAREWFPDRPFDATDEMRQRLRTFTQTLIGRYVSAIQLHVPANDDEPRVVIDAAAEQEVTMLKELTWFYVINNPSLATQQFGQRKMIRSMFQTLAKACTATPSNLDIFPTSQRELLQRLQLLTGPADEKRRQQLRVVLDLISGMTEQQAIRVYKRLEGIDGGSVLDTIYF